MDWQFEVIISEALDCLTDLLKELKGVVIKPEGYLDVNVHEDGLLQNGAVNSRVRIYSDDLFKFFILHFFFQTPCQTMEQT